MKKYLLLTTFLTIFAFRAHTQTADLASAITGDNVTDTTHTQEKLEKPIADDRGIFSFLNFSFIKKPMSIFSSDEDQKNTEETNENADNKEEAPKPKPETPLERATRLAKEGDVDMALSLGYMYLYGQDGVEQDYAKSFYFYGLAAQKDNIIALNNLGSLYFNGIGTNVDYQKASELFLRAANLGSDDAAVNLGFIYLSSERPEYFEPAIELFKKAAELNNNTAKFMLGYAYYKGFVVKQDFHRAVPLIRAAADAEFDDAHYILGNIYLNGSGIAQNYGNAIKHYRAAVAQGHIQSMMTLAQIYAEGKIYPQNLRGAHILYNIASVYGAEGAAESRDSIKAALQLEELLDAQNSAENYRENPSELTKYIRQTFGENIRRYTDDNMSKKGKGIKN